MANNDDRTAVRLWHASPSHREGSASGNSADAVIRVANGTFSVKLYLLERDLTDVDRIHIAVADDNPVDIRQVKIALDGLGLNYTLTIATDGEEARDFILKEGRYRGFPPAQLIFLDMNMPKLTGLEVLQAIPGSADLPVCMLTSSEREQHLIEEHFAPKKVSYLTKPIDGEKLIECLRCHDHLRPVADQLKNNP